MDIAGAIRAQMIGQLIDALGQRAPQAADAGGGELPALKQGQTVSATVVGEAEPGKLAIRIGQQTIIADIARTALPAEARTPGALLQLKVAGAGPEPRLQLAGVTPPPAQAAQPAQTVASPQTPSSLNTLTAQSGAPSLRAGLATISADQPQVLATTKPVAPPQPVATPLQVALREAVASAAARQGGAAPLYANLAALAQTPGTGGASSVGTATLPPEARAVATLLLANRLDGARPVEPQALKQAVTQAATPAEALAAREAPPLDAKALLGLLKAALPKPGEMPPPINRDGAPPEPPRRDGAPVAQRPAMATLAGETDPKVVTATLSREVEQAVERVKLGQYASIPEARPQGLDGPRTPQQQLIFELPIALGQQTAMAGFRVARDRKRKAEDGMPIDVWGVRFAIETDEIGAVHAHVRLAGHELSVSLWADDPLTQKAFADALPRLEAALREAALEPGEIAIMGGRPHDHRTGAAGHFLDIAS